MDENPKIEEKPETKSDLINTNVALILAENKLLKDALDASKILVEDLTKKLKQATDFIEEDSKSRLITEIVPMTNVPESILALQTVEELEKVKKVLDHAKAPTFVSGTPIVSSDKSPEAKLNSMFDEYASKTWRRGK